jgi:hypothetical protein
MGDRGDPRLNEKERDIQDALDLQAGGIRPQHRRLHDPNVTFEQYNYFAQLTRAEEDNMRDHERERGWLSIIFPSKSDAGVQQQQHDGQAKEDAPAINTHNGDQIATVTDAEWANASRALRTATRGAVFYLITTDILGPFGLPYAFATMGWG